MDVYNRNVKNELTEYMNNQDNNRGSFLEQFKLHSFDESNQQLNTKYSSPNAPTTYNVVSNDDFTMHPANEFSKITITPGTRRDNSLVINDYYSLETGSYVQPKKEMEVFSDKLKNPTALGGLSYDGFGQAVYENFSNKNENGYQQLERDRFQVSKYNSHASDDKMWQRAEATDGIPVNEGRRQMPKTLEERRGKGIHSQRLAPEGRSNKTGKTGEGKSLAPEDVTLTKFPKKKNIKQEEKDWLRTTGAFIKPEYRSKIQEPKTNRTISKSIQGPAQAINSQPVYRNNQPANPTQKEDLLQKTQVTNIKATIDKPSYRNQQMANPTNRMTENTHISNNKATIDKPIYRNEQIANPTNRMTENTHISNNRATIDKPNYRNEQAANPTNRMAENNHITNARGLNDKSAYHNQQVANPTNRMTENNHITNMRSVNDKNVYRNNQPANPTYRSEYIENNYMGTGSIDTRGYIYENQQPANPTIRSETGETNYSGGGLIESRGVVYENLQPANPTFRQETGPNDYLGPTKSLKTYKNQSDETRSGVVEDVAPKDYTGVHARSVPTTESRLVNKNFINSDRIEESLDLTEREVSGGTGQIGAGKDKAGDYTDNGKKGIKNNYKIGGRIVSSNYADTIPDTRGKVLLQKRQPIDPIISQVLDGNPYINNNVHKSTSNDDNIRSTTLMSDRVLDPVN